MTGEPVTAVIRGTAGIEQEIGTHKAVWIGYGDDLTVVVATDAAGVEIHPGHIGPPSDQEQDQIRQAVADAIAYRESGAPSVGCNACAGPDGRCAEHALDSPRLAAYREILADLSGA